MVSSVMGVMAVVLRPGLRCRGKGENEHRQDPGDPGVEGRLHIASLPERVHAKALAIAMLACRLHGLVPKGAEGLCFRAGKATRTDLYVAQLHRGLHSPISSKFELHAGNHARSIRCVLVVDCPNQAAILR
jgi:hypothetical protein